MAAFLQHAQRYYVAPDGTPSREIQNLECAVRTLAKLRGNRPTDRITIRDILEVRQALVDARETYKNGRRLQNGLSRRYVNAIVRRMKAVFRWGVEQRLVPASTWHELSALRGIPAGRGGVPDHPPVEAVPWSMVEPILPFLVPTIRDAVLVQWWSGMRPAETLAMTRRQLDASGATWLYRLAQHKGTWRGRDRIVALGPKAQAILLPRLSLAPDTPMFSGRTAWNERRAAKRCARKTPATKQMRNRDRRGERHAETVAEQLRVDEYRRAIHVACDQASVPRWSPHRLRHAAGTRIAKEIGIEAARAALGHTDVSTTRRYAAGADTAIAADVAQRLG
ncbi:MAG: site-specific integrase [Planctomycetes bacterium]|nr:site-specific integrase [Planctomycetota bacterium]